MEFPSLNSSTDLLLLVQADFISSWSLDNLMPLLSGKQECRRDSEQPPQARLREFQVLGELPGEIRVSILLFSRQCTYKILSPKGQPLTSKPYGFSTGHAILRPNTRSQFFKTISPYFTLTRKRNSRITSLGLDRTKPEFPMISLIESLGAFL